MRQGREGSPQASLPHGQPELRPTGDSGNTHPDHPIQMRESWCLHPVGRQLLEKGQALFPCSSTVLQIRSEQALAARKATGRGPQMLEGGRWKTPAAGGPSGHGCHALWVHPGPGTGFRAVSAHPVPAAHMDTQEDTESQRGRGIRPG